VRDGERLFRKLPAYAEVSDDVIGADRCTADVDLRLDTTGEIAPVPQLLTFLFAIEGRVRPFDEYLDLVSSDQDAGGGIRTPTPEGGRF
jgi:hypothetical protein